MIPKAAAHALARVLSGHELNGELGSLPAPFGAMAARLARAPAADRGALWEAMLTARDDGDALVQAVAGIDPSAPPPEVDDGGDERDGWEPIRLGSLPAAPSFPLDVLPLPARDLAESAAESIACPVDFPATAVLAAASGLIGRSVILRVKDGYHVSAAIYLALVGSPSSGKSPSLRSAMAPLWEVSEMLRARWRDAMEAWEGKDDGERGDEPELQRAVSTDPTTEALAPLLARNPRGLTVAPDEMTKWVMSMDQYKGGRGGDRPFYLSAWGGEPVYVDRAKHMKEPIAVPHPYLTVVGGMTPDMLTSLSEGRGREDGFLARLLFTFPDRAPRRYSETGIPEDTAGAWRRMAMALWDRPMLGENGMLAPRIVCMNPDASREWAGWCRRHYAEQEADGFPQSLEGAWGKLEAYTARLALVLHLMRLAADPTQSTEVAPPALPLEAVVDAGRLIDYFKAHALRVHATIDGKAQEGGDDVRALAGWVLRNGLATFSTRDIERNFDRFKDDPASLADALTWMTSHNLIRRRAEPTESPKPGRRRAPTFDVNPRLKDHPRFRLFRRNPTP